MKKILIIVSAFLVLVVPKWTGNVAFAAINAPDLAISISSETDKTTPLSEVVYNISFTNQGNTIAKNVLVGISLPQELSYLSDTSNASAGAGDFGMAWSLGVLQAGEKKSFKITVIASETNTSNVASVNVSAFIKTSTDETNLENNMASTQVLLYPNPNLSIAKPNNSNTII